MNHIDSGPENHSLETSTKHIDSAGALYFGALGVVFGDIGTSPIYALRESLAHQSSATLQIPFLLGILSLIFWSLVLVISVKYLVFMVRVNNQGEGGIMALVALLTPRKSQSKHFYNRLMILFGLFGACLLYGDGTITPAISVLSAVEGLQVAIPQLSNLIVPITVCILVALFALQKNGSGTIGSWFGAVMLLWFSLLALLGILNIANEPSVLRALNPLYAAEFLSNYGSVGFLTLGTIFLVITGGEALYADLGHFGAAPIQKAWVSLVFPALVLNYMGQGALLIDRPETVNAPFFHMAPQWATIPLVIVTTLATIIASQAVISGTFSLTRQAISLGHLPHMRIVYTDIDEEGQIYIPAVNWILMFACIGLVVGFKSSEALASAYGVAVAMDMLITTILTVCVAIKFRWNKALIVFAGLIFFIVDSSFLGANVVKIPEGGWYALLVAAFVFLIMLSWRQGRYQLAKSLAKQALSQENFFQQIEAKPPIRLPGAAVVLTAKNNSTIPPSLIHHLKCTGALHEELIILTVITLQQPHVPAADRFVVERVNQGITKIKLYFGFSQPTNVPVALKLAEHMGVDIKPEEVIYILSNETPITKNEHPGLSYWQALMFATLSKNSSNATVFYHLPEHRVLEIGVQVSL